MKRFKRSPVLWLLIVLLMLTSLPISARAEGEKPSGNVLKFQLNNKTSIVNGSMVTMDVAPTSINGRTLIPVVYVANPLGAKVDWDGSTKKVTIVLKETTLELWIGNATAKVNGADTPIDPANAEVKPIILSGRTMLPLRFVAEKLGCDVAWDAATKGITISETTATANTGGTTKPEETTKPNFGLTGPGISLTNPNMGIKDTLIGQTPGTPETKPSEEKPKENTKDLEERVKKIRTGFAPGTEKNMSYHPEGFGIYFQRKNDAAEVFYTLDELSIERNALRKKSKSGSALTAVEKANLAELDQVVPIGIQKMKQMYYDKDQDFGKALEPCIDGYYSRTMPPSPSPEGYTRYYYADWFLTEDKIGPFTLEELLKQMESLISEKGRALVKQAREDRIKELRAKGVSELEINRIMINLDLAKDSGRDKDGNLLYDFEVKPGEFQRCSCDQIMKLRWEMQKTAVGRELVERQKELIEKALADRISGLYKGQYYFEAKPGEYRVCNCNELMELSKEMRKTAEGRRLLEEQKDLIEQAIADKRKDLGKGWYYFEFKPGEYKACSCDDLMRLRREMRKTAEGRELLERQKDLIEQAIADKKEQLGGSEEKLTEYLDRFEDLPSWIRNHKKVTQNLSDENKALEVVKHLGKGYDVTTSRYGESDGVRQPVLDTQMLYQYHFLHQSIINEIIEKSIITENLREYSKKLTTEIGISGNYKCFSGSVNTNFGSEESKKTSRYYATHSIIKPEHDFYISMPGEGEQKHKNYRYFLTETAKKEINDRNFPAKALVDKYGQYVLVGLIGGAKQDYNLSVAKDKVFNKEDFSIKVKASVKAAFAGGSVEVGHSSSVSQTSFDQSVQRMIRTVGFRFAINPEELQKSVGNSLAFFDTGEKGNMVDYSRVLGKNSLIPLYEFANDALRRAEIKAEITERLEDAGKDLSNPVEPDLHNNYLVGIRLGLANEGEKEAKAKAAGTDKQYGTPRHGEPVFWKFMTNNPFETKIADLNDGVTTKDRDYIVLNLGWQKKTTTPISPIRDIYIAQNNKKKGWTNDTHNGTSGQWFLLDKDLNYNAGGTYLYLGWTFAGEKKPIVDMVLCIGKPKDLYPGWEVVKYKNTDTPANLNEGTNGSEIYLVIKRAP